MKKEFYIIVTAGGSGTRMGASVPKQFLEIGGKAVLRLTIERMLEAAPDAHIVTVLPQEHLETWRNYCQKTGFNCPQRVVSGGFTRFHSVKNALAVIPDGAVVAVHDGVRPLVSAALVARMREAMETERALIPVVPSIDTLKVLEKDGEVLKSTGETVDRGRIWGAQTPQMFRSEDLKAAYSQMFDTAFTDDASVAETFGIPLSYVEGERTNLKITTREDLRLAEALLSLE